MRLVGGVFLLIFKMIYADEGLDIKTLLRKDDSKLQNNTKSTTHAELMISERVTGMSHTISIPIGKTYRFKSLKMKIYHCYKAPPEEKPESTAFINLWDYPEDGLPQRVLTGWIFASSPAVSIAQHPRYVVGIKKCYTPEEELQDLVEELTESEDL